MAAPTLGEALAILESDHMAVTLDLERDLGGRDPPATSQAVRDMSKGWKKKFEIGSALMHSHRLEDMGCQCRHNLEPDQRIERGVTASKERSGVCPLNTHLDTTCLSFAQPLTRLTLAGRGVLDDDVMHLVAALRGNMSVTELSLQGNAIGNAGARKLAEFIADDNRLLVDLDLAHNGIGDTGATALAEALRHNYTLTELCLDGNPVRQAGMHALFEVCARNPFCRVVMPTYRAVNECEHHKVEKPKEKKR